MTTSSRGLWTSSLTLLVLGGVGCSDYQLKGRSPAEPTPPLDSGVIDTAIQDSATPLECPAPDLAARSQAMDADCSVPPPTGTFTPVIRWTDSSVGYACATPVVGELTDDNADGLVDASDLPDIVVVNDLSTGGVMSVLSGDGSGVHWSVGNLGNEPSSPAIGDLNADGRPDVVVAGYIPGATEGFVEAHDGSTGASLWRVYTPMYLTQASLGGPGIYDLEGDGSVEVVVGALILDGATGAMRGFGTQGIGSGYFYGSVGAFGVAADIDADGLGLEVVVGNALYRADGSTIWANGQSDGYVAVGNFDGDPQGEIVVTWLDGNVRLQDDDGVVLWQALGVVPGDSIGPPTVADFDGDGQPEIGVAGKSNYLVVETDGTLKWSVPIHDSSSGFLGSSVFDFEGDGRAEVVVADERSVWIFDGSTGAVRMEETRHSSPTGSEYPTIADVDNDGHAEIIFTNGAFGSGTENGVSVIGDQGGSWMPGRNTWNQHAYAITNINEDGTCPVQPVSNWPTYNNFRSGDMTALVGSGTPDAVPAGLDLCDLECASGRLELVTRVGNAGALNLAAGTEVSVYAKSGDDWQWVATQRTASSVEAGQTSEGLVFDLDAAVVGDALRVVVDDDGTGAGTLSECHEDNNALELAGPFCL